MEGAGGGNDFVWTRRDSSGSDSAGLLKRRWMSGNLLVGCRVRGPEGGGYGTAKTILTENGQGTAAPFLWHFISLDLGLSQSIEMCGAPTLIAPPHPSNNKHSSCSFAAEASLRVRELTSEQFSNLAKG